ncbi:MAG TPA: isoleucine--tRNA ligase [Acidimicrobiia bacterium]|nr:isoleucine--tRNA ligase [Acidimicrobiia bacterium]
MAERSSFTRVAPAVAFPELEQGILDLWAETDAFAESVRSRPAENEYVFYDGPPFPTGSPHYGNLLAGVIKDVVPRYWTMRGFRVERRFGWDTHGLPIEMEVEKQLGISGPRQIAEYGIDRFNEACRNLVATNTENWERITTRVGRWVDFEDDYKTMDVTFMESVWWVFRQLWDRGLIYQDFKVLPYSFGATTPLSNFEANMDYRDVDDPSITVLLPVVDGRGPVEDKDCLLVWTTTPWTLPGNLAVAVGEDIEYVRVEIGEGSDWPPGRFWIAHDLVGSYWPVPPVITAQARGADLVGVSYLPPFDNFGEERDRGAFRVLPSDSVTTGEGTGLVHMAPAYGEADFFTLQAAGLDVLVDPVDAEGRFTDAVPEVTGLNIKEADKILIRLLDEKGLLVRSERTRHSYPFCYRTGTPLIYKAIPTWFVRVEQIKERLLANNSAIHWVPDYVGSKRFGNWLEGARDWAVSRNRYWGSCIPVWICENTHQVCVGSIDELEQLSGIRLADLHKHFVDPVTFPCPQCGATMTRVPEVLDCWFESGSMPYGQLHYPFENQARFEATFPARFIAEGLDQTRGWFYTLHVLAAALFDGPAFQNCVVNGLILAEDGRKMSKSLKNYPDPEEIFHEAGADALRAFLINSPVLRAEPVRFSREGVREVVRTVLLPLWNAYSFFTTYAEADGLTLEELESAPSPGERPEMDRWILSVLQSLIADVNEQMEGYYLYNVIPSVLGFVDDLTNWYVRRSRRRFWRTRGEDDTDKLAAFATLYEILVRFVEVLAPVLPFVTEHIYRDLVARLDLEAPVSVHLRMYPQASADLIDKPLEYDMAIAREVVRLGHSLRKQNQLRVRRPLSRLTVISSDHSLMRAVNRHAGLIADEINVKSVDTTESRHGLVKLAAKANFKSLGPRLGPSTASVAKQIAALDEDSIAQLMAGESLELEGISITAADVVIERSAAPETIVAASGDLAVSLDFASDPALVAEGLAREVISRIQQLRREVGLAVSDRISVAWSTDDERLAQSIRTHDAYIAGEILAVEFGEAARSDDPVEIDIEEARLLVSLKPARA